MAFFRRRTGLVNPSASTNRVTNDDFRLSTTSNLSMATWNCGGLTKIKKDLCFDLDLDVLCLTETHGWRDDDCLTIHSDPPGKDDSWAGVAITINQRISRYIISSGSIGSRIVYCRLRGASCNILIIGVYIPTKTRKKPDQNAIYDQLDSLLAKTGKRDCTIMMGDFNSRLKRNINHRVGKWCIHNRTDEGGARLLNIMDTMSMRCVSTYFQPPRKHTNATFMNIQPGKAPSQIDYVFASSRWSYAIRDCKTKWGVSIKSYGRKYDHALIKFEFQIHLKCDRRSKRKDFKTLKQPEIALAHNEKILNEFNNTERPPDISEQFKRLTEIMTSAQEAIPDVPRRSTGKWKTSEKTSALLTERANTWDNRNNDQRKAVTKNISRSARNDYRTYVNKVLDDIEEAEAAGNSSDIFKLSRQLSTKRNGNNFVQPVIDDCGNTITTTEQQHELWADFLGKKFAALPEESEVDLSDPDDTSDPPTITIEEVKECVKHLKSGKATGPDMVPVEQYKASNDATVELFHLLQHTWNSEIMPEDFVLADMMLFYKKK